MYSSFHRLLTKTSKSIAPLLSLTFLHLFKKSIYNATE